MAFARHSGPVRAVLPRECVTSTVRNRHEEKPCNRDCRPLRVAPDAYAAVRALNDYVDSSGLEAGLLDLVKTRASQINGCAFCIHMHTRDARARGETEERLYLLDAWRESPLYSDARAGGARLDRSADPDRRDACAGRRLCRGARPVFRGGAGQAHGRDRRDQHRGTALAIGFRYTHPVGASKAA